MTNSSSGLQQFAQDLAGECGLALYASCRRPGYHLDLAVGELGNATPATVGDEFQLYCSSKPVMAQAAVWPLCERYGLGVLNLSLDELVPDLRVVGRWDRPPTLRELLAHDCGLGSPTGLEYVFYSESRRIDYGTKLSVSSTPEFSEVGLQTVLRQLAAAEFGTPLGALVRVHLDELGLEDRLRLTGSSQRLVPHFERVAGTRIPLLHELLPDRLENEQIALVGLQGSASGLADWGFRFMRRAGNVETDIVAEVIERELHCLPAGRLDKQTGRISSYAMGFMANLAAHGISTTVVDSIGHTGLLCSSVMLLDRTTSSSYVVLSSDIEFAEAGGVPGAAVRSLLRFMEACK